MSDSNPVNEPALKATLMIVCLLLAGTVDAKDLEFPELNFRMTLASSFKVKSLQKRFSSDGGELFNANSRRLRQSFSCSYDPLPEGLPAPKNASQSRALLTAFGKAIGNTHAAGTGPIGEPRFETRSGIDFYRFRMDAGLPEMKVNTVAFYHLFTRGDWIVVCGSYHVPDQGQLQDEMADSIQPLDSQKEDPSSPSGD